MREIKSRPALAGRRGSLRLARSVLRYERLVRLTAIGQTATCSATQCPQTSFGVETGSGGGDNCSDYRRRHVRQRRRHCRRRSFTRHLFHGRDYPHGCSKFLAGGCLRGDESVRRNGRRTACLKVKRAVNEAGTQMTRVMRCGLSYDLSLLQIARFNLS